MCVCVCVCKSGDIRLSYPRERAHVTPGFPGGNTSARTRYTESPRVSTPRVPPEYPSKTLLRAVECVVSTGCIACHSTEYD